MVYNIFSLITFFSNLILAVVIILNNPRREINRVLGSFALILSFWTLILFASQYSRELSVFEVLGRLNFSMMLVCAYLLLYFVEIFPNGKFSENKHLLFFLIPIPLIWLGLATDIFISGAKRNMIGMELTRGSLYPIYIAVFAFYILTATFRLYQKYRNNQGLVKLQTRYALTGVFVLMVGASITNLIMPVLGVNLFIYYGPLFTLPFVAMLAYSIMKYRLLDIAIFIRKSLVYFVLVTFITTVYVMMFLLMQTVFSGMHISISIFVSLLSAVLIAVTMDPLKDLLGRWTDKVFFKGKYDYYKVLKMLGQTLSSVLKVDELIAKVIDTITVAMRLDYTAIFILERNSGAFVANRTVKDGLVWSGRIEQEDPVVSCISEKKEALIFDELEYTISEKVECGAIKESFLRLQAKVFVPIILKEKLIGMLVLGGKKSDDIFTQEDLDLLDMISHQISVVLENTNLYEQMLNTAKLALVGTMAAGMAHEIRNPLTSMKTFMQILPDKHTDRVFIERFSAVVGEEINRLSHLTEDLLSFSKSKPHKYEPIEVNAVIEKVTELFEMQIGKKRIELKKKIGSVPPAYADEEQLTQVFMNMLINSMQALGEKKEIIIETGTETRENLLKYSTVMISDTGSGIPEQNLARIFDPFFTTKKEGTGLGLAICMKIIQEHNGFIEVKSKPSEGTSFKIFLPAYNTK